MTERDIKVLVTVRLYDAIEPAQVIRQLMNTPNDVAWSSTAHGEFEILAAELA